MQHIAHGACRNRMMNVHNIIFYKYKRHTHTRAPHINAHTALSHTPHYRTHNRSTHYCTHNRTHYRAHCRTHAHHRAYTPAQVAHTSARTRDTRTSVRAHTRAPRRVFTKRPRRHSNSGCDYAPARTYPVRTICVRRGDGDPHNGRGWRFLTIKARECTYGKRIAVAF